MVDAFQIPIGGPHRVGQAPIISFVTLDGVADKTAWVFSPLTTGTITQLFYMTSSSSGTAPTYKISLQGVDVSGDPDGTILGGGSPASATFTPVSQNTGSWITLDNSYAVQSTDTLLAIVIEHDSGTIDSGNRMRFFTNISSNYRHTLPAVLTDLSVGSWTRVNVFPILGYGTSTRKFGLPLFTNTITTAYNNSDTPDEHAMKFTIPDWIGTCTIIGFTHSMSAVAGGSYKYILYSGGGVSDITPIQEVVIDADGMIGTRVTSISFLDSTPTTLVGGQTYRLSIEPQNTTDLTIRHYSFEAAGDLEALQWGGAFTMSNRKGGNWTDVPLTVMLAEVILGDITGLSGGGGGLILHPGMTGGLNG